MANRLTEREYMELAISAMRETIVEKRSDGKVSPKVGGVIVFPDNSYDTSSRCELREGQHCEEILLDVKHSKEKLDGATLFVTLEPCVPESRSKVKTACAKRIVDARISTVYIGMLDPNPEIYRLGVDYLRQRGVTVKMFDPDLITTIEKENKDFIAFIKSIDTKDTKNYRLIDKLAKKTLSEEAIELYATETQIDISVNYHKVWDELLLSKLICEKDGKYIISDMCGIIFGNKATQFSPGAAISFSYERNGKEHHDLYDGAMLLATKYLENWLSHNFPKNVMTRSRAVTEYDFEIPLLPLKEGLVNAVVHRDYSKDGGYVYFTVHERGMNIDSPGQPEPITTISELNAFQAVPYSRNGIMSTIFARTHLMEKTQYGMKTFAKMREVYGIPQPQYEQKGMYVRLFFPKNDSCASNIIAKKDMTLKLSKSLLLCYEFVRQHGEVSRIAYQEYAGLIPKTAVRHLTQLIEMGLIETNGEPTNSPKIKYRIRK